MLYLVGGVARSGKSTTASSMLKQYGVPYLSLDTLRWGLTKGAPGLGIHADNDDNDDAKRLWPIMEFMIENILFDGRDYLIEGVCLLPELVSLCLRENPDAVRTCFLGYPDIDLESKIAATMKYEGPNDWLRRLGPDAVRDFIEGAIYRSIKVRSECDDFGIPFVNSGENYPHAIKEAVKALTVQGDRPYSV